MDGIQLLALTPAPVTLQTSVSTWLQLDLLEPQAGTIAEQIATVLYGSRKIRLGKAPTAEQRAFMIQRIQAFVQLGYPVEVYLMWGAAKNYGADPTRWEADVLDMLGIQRFARLAAQVKSIYAPGLVVRLIQQDVDRRLLTNRPHDLEDQMRTYSQSLETLANVLRPEQDVGFLNESELVVGHGHPIHEYMQHAKETGCYLYDYLWTSNHHSPEAWELLPEYENLVKATGWKGLIPHEQREHYRKRTAHAYLELSEDRQLWMLSLYLACALTRRKMGVLEGTFGPTPIFASYVPHPPGSPPSMLLGRVEYKVRDSLKTNIYAPWSGYGAIQVDKSGSMKVISIDKDMPYEPSRIELSSSGGRCEIRADLVVLNA